MNIWLAAREYAGIAEAGGVKNVSCSLSESLVKLGHKVVFFIPLYRCTNLSKIENFTCFYHQPVQLELTDRKRVPVSFAHGTMNGVEIVFVCHKSFAEKNAVYTYTKKDQEENCEHIQGTGHKDVMFLNMLFQKAVVEFSRTCSKEEIPDVIHCQDAACALIPNFAAQNPLLKDTRCIVTIHNAGPGYHHNYADIAQAEYFTNLDRSILCYGANGYSIEPYVLCTLNATLTTVSPEYAAEILNGTTNTDGLSEIFRQHNTSIVGITNGIDFDRYDPTDVNKSQLPFAYDPRNGDLKNKYGANRKIFLETYASKEKIKTADITQYGFIEGEPKDIYIAYHGRVVHQKGIEIVARLAESICSKNLNVKFIFAGQGAPELENMLKDIAERYPGKCVYLCGYDKIVARLSLAAADFSLHPSYFEPCGLEDFIAQIFGTLPIAHATGGLCKIINGKTGYLYSPNTAEHLESIVLSLISQINSEGIESLKETIKYAANYIFDRYSWDKVAGEYLKLYK